MSTIVSYKHTNSPTNLLLIDDSVSDYSFLVDSTNSETAVIVYSRFTTKTDMLMHIQTHYTNIPRIGICFLSATNTPVLFLDEEPLFTTDASSPYSANTLFLIQLLTTLHTQTIDFLACDTLLYPEWASFYRILTQETGVLVGASNDKTGNLLYGGDWEMESTFQNVELIYFESSIQYYTFLFDLQNTLFAYSDTNNLYACGNGSAFNAFLNGQPSNPVTVLTSTIGIGYDSTIANVFITNSSTDAGSAINLFILLSNNILVAKGLNNVGSLGLGVDEGGDYNLTQVNSLPSNKIIVYIGCTIYYTVILMSDGTLYGAGSNSGAAIGLPSNIITTNIFLQISIPNGKKARQISVGLNHTIALMEDGTVYAAGYNTYGQLGLDTGVSDTLQFNGFAQVTLPSGKTASYITCGKHNTFILMTDNTLYAVGYNINGQLGLGTNTNVDTLTQITQLPNGKISAIVCGDSHTVLLFTNGEIYACGSNTYGQLGLGNTTNANTFQRVTPFNSSSIVGASCQFNGTILLYENGELYATGQNTSNGFLGLNTISYTPTFTHVPVPNNEPIVWINNMISITPVCFGENTLILTNRGYVPIHQLQKNDLVQTYKHGLVKIHSVGKGTMYNNGDSSRRNKSQLFVCSLEKYPELFTDLVLTGCHSVLVDTLTSRQRDHAKYVLGNIYQTDDKYRLPVCADHRAAVYPRAGKHTIYHIALEHADDTRNYGVYANGLLVETCSIRYLRDFSKLAIQYSPTSMNPLR
jgi:alpha-tubulin suppressor-like RCC1 family protein